MTLYVTAEEAATVATGDIVAALPAAAAAAGRAAPAADQAAFKGNYIQNILTLSE